LPERVGAAARYGRYSQRLALVDKFECFKAENGHTGKQKLIGDGKLDKGSKKLAFMKNPYSNQGQFFKNSVFSSGSTFQY